MNNSKIAIKTIALSELQKADYNPRIDLKPGDKEYEKIKRSIEEFGYVEPVIVNKDKTIIGGHQRIKVLKDLGYENIECVVVDLDKTKEKALNIALNRIEGGWDYNKLEQVLNELAESDFDVEITGFSNEEIENASQDLISDLLQDDYVDLKEELKVFSMTFVIDKQYKEDFDMFIKKNGKEPLINAMVDMIRGEEQCQTAEVK